jgi:hypothetical protein
MAESDRNLAIERLRARAELRSADLEEDTGQIEVTALSRAPKSSSTPPRAKFVLALLNAKPSWQMVIIVLAALGALFGGGMLRPVLDHLMGWAK